MKEHLMGYEVDSRPVEGCVEGILDTLIGDPSTNRRCAWLACLNPHSYAVALEDRLFRCALNDADWLVPDGVGVVLASKVLGGNIRQRVTGSDIYFELHQRINAVGNMSVFFLGATEETLAKIRAKMAREFPQIRIAGTYSPPFKSMYSDEELASMISAVNAAQPDVLWVGMTAPKQEKWIHENRDKLNVRFAGAIGAVFDFYAGRVKRSHPLFQRFGLEWLPRLVQQPSRLWRRMFISAPIFLWAVFCTRFCQR